MNDTEVNKLIINSSWLFEAIINQYRLIINDIKKCLMFSNYKLSPIFGNFNKNIRLSFSLISQGKRNFEVMLKRSAFSKQVLVNIYKMYIKRAIYQEKEALEYLNKLQYDQNINFDNLFKNIMAKMYNLHSLLMDLERKTYLLCA